MQLSQEVKSLLLRLGETPENFTGRIIFMSMLTTSHVDQKTMKKNANPMLDSFLYMRKDLTGIHTYIDLRVAQEKQLRVTLPSFHGSGAVSSFRAPVRQHGRGSREDGHRAHEARKSAARDTARTPKAYDHDVPS